MKIEEKERSCLELLGKLPVRYVLIGGYAVSAFEFPRFSVDLEIVISEKDLEEFSAILKEEGFSRMQETDHFAQAYEGRSVRFQKMVESLPVSVDLLVGMVQCRQTDAAYSFEYVWRNSGTMVVTGFGVRAAAEARVAGREMLVALKINAMRIADRRDIIAPCSAKVDATRVAGHLRRAPAGKISANIRSLLAFLEEPRSKDSLKGVFVFSESVLDRLLLRTRETLLEIGKKLERKSSQKG
jgi:hypothetical protein